MKTNNDTLNAIQTMVDSAVNKAGYDKTRNAVVIARNANNTYKIKMDGIEYDNVVFYGSGEAQVNEVVKVVIPNNQASQMYVMGKGSNTSEIWTNLDEIWTILDNILGKLGVDWVVEEGNDGDTRWRKWNSGISEFWFEADATYTIGTARGNWYSGNEVSRNFPNGLFVATPSMVFEQAISTTAYVIFAQCTGLSRTTYKYRLVANASVAAATHSVSAYAIGRWK